MGKREDRQRKPAISICKVTKEEALLGAYIAGEREGGYKYIVGFGEGYIYNMGEEGDRQPINGILTEGEGRYTHIKYGSSRGHVYMEWGEDRQPAITIYDQVPQGRGRQL